MNIIILDNSMRITAEDNKLLTRIVRLVDGTPLYWFTISDTVMVVCGKKEMLYELLSEITKVYMGKIEII